ncbi:MAG: oligopeptidase B [Deltaproteobacteria bacterium]|nr:oligopeptidase B [Deltaproteobacteria bacterium]HCH66326.1 oligopeptidase B [Deltaproteobacteria bacterium]
MSNTSDPPPVSPPIARREPRRLETHGHVREDPYFWMRDDHREDPEILAHLRAEQAYADAVLAPLNETRAELYDEIVSRIPQDDTSVPYRLDGWWYYHRVEQGREYPIYCRRRGSVDTAEEVFLDANQRADGHAYYSLGGASVSVSGHLLAFTEDTVSRRIYTLRFRDLRTGEDLEDEIEGTTGSVVWALDNRTVFYVRQHETTLRAYQVWRHTLGTAASEDTMVFEETDSEFYVGIRRSRSRDYILIGSFQTLSREYRYIDAREPSSAPVVVLPREARHEYDVDHAHGRFYIRTNWQAQDFRLMSVAPEQSTDKGCWREEVPTREGVFFRGSVLFRDYLVVSERRDGLTRLRVIPWTEAHTPDVSQSHELAQDEVAYFVGTGTNSEFETTTLRYTYESMTTPHTVYDYDMGTRSRTLRKQLPVPRFNAEDYVAHRLRVPARDGTLVYVSVVHRKDLDRTRPQPLLQYGYGSYGMSMDPRFNASRISLLDRGAIFAIAHIRGGQELGRAWYEDGKLRNKRNTFTDFIDVADYLVQEGWTSPDRLFAQGGSAGGLLVGAVVNMRPDLWRAVVANVPFVDVVTTMLDASIPLTTFEYDEWGNPNTRGDYDYMLSYSPYDNVVAQAYPEMLVITGLHDSQVQYWEPAKWVARLRYRSTSDHRVLFSVNLDAGHGGASGRFRRHRETAMVFAFLLDLVPDAA